MTKRKNSRRSKKNMLSRGFSSIRNTTKRIIPGLTYSIKGVGKKVVGTAKQTIPKAQSSIRNLFGMFGLKSKKSKSRRTRRRR